MQCRVSLSVLHLVSWFHQSVVISPDIRSIKLILREQKKQGWLLEILFVQTVCVCLCVHVQLWLCMKHTPVFSRVDLNVPRVPVYVCIYSFFFFFTCLYFCVCTLRCHQYTQGQVHSMLRDSKSREGAYKWPPELTTVMNYGRALSRDTTPTSKNMTAVCEAKCNRHISQWKTQINTANLQSYQFG